MRNEREWEWRAAGGYSIDEANGIARKQEETACTLHFYLAEQGDSLQILDADYEYAVATYGFEVDPKYIYTYDYQTEENWAEYRHDFSENAYTQRDYVFSENCFFRVVVRKKSGISTENAWGDFGDLGRILKWKSGRKPLQTGAKFEKGSWYGRLEGLLKTGDALEKEIQDTVSKVGCKKTEESLQFLLMSDSHYTVNGTWADTVHDLRQTVNALAQNDICLDGFLHLGDMTDGLTPAEVTRDYVTVVQRDIRALGMPLYYVLGNHDSNYFRNNPERFSEQEMLELYLPEEQKGYYYRDFPGQRLRMFFLESFNPLEQVRYGFPEEELDWLEEMLGSLQTDWYVLVFSHVPPTPRLHYWSKEIRGSDRLLQILKDFQKSSRLLGFIHGHNHADQVDYEEGFPIISVGCNKCEYFEDKKPEGSVTYERKPGEVIQDLWDVLVISVEKGTLDFIRFGAGEDRHISL